MTTGEKIRQVRKRRNLTQKQLGELAGIAEPTIRRYELGKLNPKFETLQKIASALDVYIADLLDTQSADIYQAGIDLGSDLEEWQNHIIDELWKRDGYSGSDNEVRLIRSFSRLTDEGQLKTIQYVEGLADNPEFQAPITLQEDSPPEEILFLGSEIGQPPDKQKKTPQD